MYYIQLTNLEYVDRKLDALRERKALYEEH